MTGRTFASLDQIRKPPAFTAGEPEAGNHSCGHTVGARCELAVDICTVCRCGHNYGAGHAAGHVELDSGLTYLHPCVVAGCTCEGYGGAVPKISPNLTLGTINRLGLALTRRQP